EVDDRMRGLRIELGTVCPFQAQGRARESDRGQLESQADALEWHLVLRREAGPGDLPLDPAVPEPSRDHDAIGVLEGFRALFLHVIVSRGGLAPRDDHVPLDRGGPDSPAAFLRRLRLLLPDRAHDWDEGRVDEEDVILPHIVAKLATRVADGHRPVVATLAAA